MFDFVEPTQEDLYALLGLGAVLVLALAVDFRHDRDAKWLTWVGFSALFVNAVLTGGALGGLAYGGSKSLIWAIAILAVIATSFVLGANYIVRYLRDTSHDDG